MALSSRWARSMGTRSPCTETPRGRDLPDAGGGSEGRGVRFVDEPLADFDDVAVRVLHPNRPPAREEGVEIHRALTDHGVPPHRGEFSVDVVHLEREVAWAGRPGTVADRR